MKVLAGVSIALLLSSGLFAQRRGGGFSGAQPKVTGSFGSVIFPGGTPATSPGTQRFFGSVAFPGGGGPRLVVPNTKNLTLGGPRNGLGLYGAQFGYGVPWFYYGSPDVNASDYVPDQGAAAQQPAALLQPPAQPNVMIIFPPQGWQPPSGAQGETRNWSSYPPAQTPSAAEEPAAPEQPNYLLAFKDHNIYPAVAYWVDGNTLHYITSGNHHNQASLDLLDRALTERLSKEAGYEVKLPK